MTEATTQHNPDELYGAGHVQAYRETGGELGHEWRGATVLILTTKGSKTGEERSTPLIYRERDGDHVLIASNGGSQKPPSWFTNLEANPEAVIQVMDEQFNVRPRIAEGEEREQLWRLMNEQWPAYDSYQERADRQIQVVVLERV